MMQFTYYLVLEKALLLLLILLEYCQFMENTEMAEIDNSLEPFPFAYIILRTEQGTVRPSLK